MQLKMYPHNIVFPVLMRVLMPQILFLRVSIFEYFYTHFVSVVQLYACDFTVFWATFKYDFNYF